MRRGAGNRAAVARLIQGSTPAMHIVCDIEHTTEIRMHACSSAQIHELE
jgi:hypothetical protein